MSDDLVNIEIDGVARKARKGAMIIQVTDAEGAYIPRFCYHEKLSVAANCRMCLVEVEKAPKPMPACATPVVEGMKVFTRSPRAIAAQKATMEFLLINHPLDCPICDQGGECELQDLAMGYGRDVSRYTERKRVVKDKNLGPLVSTDMTRCIQCTRCVRFGEEIAGIQELGTVGRGELMQISTYVEKSVDHELSGNIIDLCPVGALNNKAYRYRARAWEMSQHALVSPHDCVGTNLYGHVLRGRLMRVVPRANDEINETWIADRDRFSCEGLYTEDRARRPLQKVDGEWREADWETALAGAADALRKAIEQHGADQVGFLVAPGATLEEHALAARLARGLGCVNIDYRLQQLRLPFAGRRSAGAAARLPDRRARDRSRGAGRGQQPARRGAVDRAPAAQGRGAARRESGADRAAPAGAAVPDHREPDEQRARNGPAPRCGSARRPRGAGSCTAGVAACRRRESHSRPGARRDRSDAGRRRAAPRPARRARAAPSRLVGDPCARRSAGRDHRRAPGVSARRR